MGLTSLRSDTPSQGIVIVACAATKHQYMGHPITRTGPARGPLTKPNYLYIMCLSVYGVPRRHSRHVYFIAMYSQYSLRGSIERAYWPTCDRCRSRSFLDFFSVHCPKLARARHHLCVASSLTASPHRTAPRRPLSILVARGDRATGRDDTTPQEVLRLLLQPADRVHHRLLPLHPPLRHEHRRQLLRPPTRPGPSPLLLPGATALLHPPCHPPCHC